MNEVYSLIAKYSSDTKHYLIQNELGKRIRVTDMQLYFLIGAGRIKNYNLMFFKGTPVLKSVDSKVSLRVIDEASNKYIIEEEVVDENRTVGYNIRKGSERFKNVNIVNIISYAKAGAIEGAKYNESDNLIYFDDTDKIMSIPVVDVKSGKKIFRSLLKTDYKLENIEHTVELSPIGKIESIAYGQDTSKFADSIDVSIKTFTYGVMKLASLSRKYIRIGNATNIFDIMLNIKDDCEFTRDGVINTIADTINHFDFNSKQVVVTLSDEDGQELAKYEYNF